MPDFLTFASRMAAALSAALLASAPVSAEAPGEMRLKLTAIMDPTGFEKPLTAARSVIPADWNAQGGVVWRLGAGCNSGQSVDWGAASPDGKAMIRLLPAVSWTFNSQGMPAGQGCLSAAYNSADEYVQGYIGQFHNAKIVKVERDPQTMQFLSQYPFYSEMPGDPYMKGWWDAASVTFTFDIEGTAFTGTLIVYSTHNYTVSGHSYGFGPPLEMGYGAATSQVLLVAPTARLGEFVPAFLLFLKNYQVDPDWQARMNKHNATMSAEAIKTSGEISKIISRTYSDISDMNMETWRSQNETSDRMQRETSEWIRDVETYDADTPTGQVELPTGYDRAFQLNDDTFVVTNDTSYEPYRDSGVDGRELTVTR